MPRSMRACSWLAIGLAAVGVSYKLVQAAEDDDKKKPKHSIEEVMHNAHLAPEGQKSLRDRVLEGQATPKEQKELLGLYISLAENEPPRGDADAFDKKTRAVVLSAAKIVVGRKEGVEELRKATTCAACHKDHKPPQD